MPSQMLAHKRASIKKVELTMNVARYLGSGKYYFGFLCKNNHDNSGDGRSLRNIMPGKNGDCKECKLEASNRIRIKNKERYSQESKKRYHKDIDASRQKSKEYREKNKEAFSEYAKKNYYKHREDHLQRMREQRASNPEKYRAQSRKHYYANRDRILKKHSAYKKANRKPKPSKRLKEWWVFRKPLEKQISSHRYRARKYGCTIEDYSVCEAQAIFDKFNNECAYCGSTEKIGVDHYIPLCKGGSESLTNIVPCCYRCNLRKSDTDGWKWFSQQESYTIDKYVAILKTTGVIG